MNQDKIRRLHDDRNSKISAAHNDWQSGHVTTQAYAIRIHALMSEHDRAFSEVMDSHRTTTVRVPEDVMATIRNLKEAMALPKSKQNDYTVSVLRDVVAEKLVDIVLSK